MKFNQFKEELQELIIEGNTQDAVNQLLNICREVQGEYEDEVIVLAGRLKQLKDREIAGVLDHDDADRQSNAIKYDLLQIIDALDQDPAVAKYFGLSTSQPKPSKPENRLLMPTVIVTLLVGLAAGLFYLSNQRNPSSDIQVEESTDIVLPKKNEKTITKPIATPERTPEPIENKNDRPTPANRKPENSSNELHADEEPNNTINTAIPLLINQSTNGLITPNKKDVDYYKIQVDEHKNSVVFEVKPISADMLVELTVFDERGYSMGKTRAEDNGAVAKMPVKIKGAIYSAEVKGAINTSGSYTIKAYYE